jgi:Holliday junction resolvase YEN1
MGVPGLWKELHPYGNDIGLNSLGNLASNAASTSSSPQRETLRLGIDVSSWIYHAAKSTGGHNPQLRSFFWRLCRMLTLPHVLPVFVFDGPLRPREKRGRVIQVYREASFVNTLKDLIVAFGFVVVEAAGEAEAEMSRMTQRGSLDAILSDDVDCFVFGATIVVRK